MSRKEVLNHTREIMSGKDNDNDDKAMSDALAKVAQLDKKRRGHFEEREAALKRERKAFEEEKKLYGAKKEGNASDVISLNVGGTRMDVLRRTLTQVEGSLLATKFSGRWDDSLEKDRHGNFFIDQPFDLFEMLVNILRSKQNEVVGAPTTNIPQRSTNFDGKEDKWNRFLIMVEYYGVAHALFPLQLKHFYGDEQTSTVDVLYHPGIELTDDSFRAVRLETQRVAVTSFEVCVSTEVKDFHIGWTSANACTHRVGTYENSIGLDIVRFEKHLGGRTERLERPTSDNQEGKSITIRCERDGLVFFVNDEEIFRGVPDVTPVASDIPAISGTGTWQITKVNYKYW